MLREIDKEKLKCFSEEAIIKVANRKLKYDKAISTLLALRTLYENQAYSPRSEYTAKSNEFINKKKAYRKLIFRDYKGRNQETDEYQTFELGNWDNRWYVK